MNRKGLSGVGVRFRTIALAIQSLERWVTICHKMGTEIFQKGRPVGFIRFHLYLTVTGIHESMGRLTIERRMSVYLDRRGCYAIGAPELNRFSELNFGVPTLMSSVYILFEREEPMPETDQLYVAVPSAGRLHEHTFNIEFGKVLAETDARWRAHFDEYILPERSGTLSSGRADILIDDPQMPAAAIEASFNPADADRDAEARLGQNTTRGGRPLLAVLALHIPEEY